MIKNIITFLFVCISTSLFATTFTASTGTWSLLTWSPAGPPGASDDIIIPTGVTVTMDADYTTSATLTLQGTGTIEMAGYNLTVGSLTAAGSAIINNGGALATISIGSANTSTSYTGIFTGPISITKSGSGTLTLSGSNTFTGNNTIINNGTNTFTISGTNSFGGNVTIANSNTGSLTISGTNTYSGTASITNSSSGSFTFSGANTISGAVTVTNDGTGSISFNIGNTFSNDVNITISNTGSVIFGNTSGTTLFNGNIVLNRTYNASSSNYAMLYLGNSGSASLADGKTITCNTSAYIRFKNFTQIGTTAQVINAGSASGSTNGTLYFDSGTTFNGDLTASGRWLFLSGGTFNGTTTLNKTGGNDNGSTGNLIFNGPTTISNSNGGGAKIQINSGSTITMNNTLTFAGSSTIQISCAIANGGYLITNSNTGSVSFEGIVSGSGGITNSGSGTLALSAANTYSGNTTISAGSISLSNATALGDVSAGTVVESGGSLNLNGITYSSAESVTISGTGTSSVGAIRNGSSTTATFPGLITLAANSSILGSTGSITLSNTGTITGSGYTLTLSGNTGGTVNSIIGTDAGGITKSGTGTWTLAGANTYTGAASISAGILKLGNVSALGTNASGTTITSGAALDLNGYVLSSAEALTISGTGVSSGGALINTGAATSYSGSVTLGAATTITTANDITLSGTISPSTYTLSKAGTASLILDNNTVTINGLTISAGTVNASTATLNLSGAFTNSGTFTCGTGTVNFVGSAAQSIPALTYYNLTLNNTTSPATSAATLAGNISVGGTLTLTTGVLNTSTYTIDLGANGSISESNPSVLAPTSYVTGYVSATRNTGSTSGTVTFGGLGLEITETTQTDNSTVVTRRTGTASSGNSKSSILRYFDITPTIDAGLNGTLVFHYTTAEIASHTEANLKMYKANSPYTTWIKQSSSSVDETSNTVTLTGITDFSRWTASDQVTQPLPVNFLSFSVKSESGINKLTWSTASELNNDYFEIELSNNGIDFTMIDKIKGAGTVNTISEYVYFDSKSNQNNSSYYRLKQVDFDKNHSYSSIINSKLIDKFQQFSIYPNPLKYGDILHVRLNNISSESESIVVKIFDLSGKLMLQNDFQNINNQYATQLINQNNTLKKGVYLIEIKTLNNKFVERLEVE